MNRADSAFDETFGLKISEDERRTSRRGDTTSSRYENSQHNPAKMNMNDQISTASTVRPASEKPAPAQRRSTEPNRKSITTTSSNSAKSRKRGHASLPSSRRTSCTIIDPSRPTRHYRINSAQTCPTLNRDIDDVLALHFRSCTLFQNSAYQANIPTPAISAEGLSAPTDFAAMQGPLPQPSSHESASPNVKDDEKASATADADDATMHWMSPSTRKSQYEKIDRANNGLRALLRKFLPKCVSGPRPQRFYEEEKSDAGSVRRYRMDLSDGEGDEMGASGLKMQRRKLERSKTEKSAARKKILGCL